MSVSLYNFLPHVLPSVGGCPDIVAVDAVRTAIIQLCEWGSVWRYEFDVMDVVANSPDYQLDVPTGAYVYSIVGATYNGVPLTPTTTQALDGSYTNWRQQTGLPTMFYRSADDTINLVYMPDVSTSSSLVVTALLEPTRNASIVEDFLFQRYLPDVAIGALAKLMLMPGPWGNPQLAAKYEMDFTVACNRHRAALFSDMANVRLRARSPYKFR